MVAADAAFEAWAEVPARQRGALISKAQKKEKKIVCVLRFFVLFFLVCLFV